MKSKTLALILLCCAASLGAKVKLPALVSDNMVLQQQPAKPFKGISILL